MVIARDQRLVNVDRVGDGLAETVTLENHVEELCCLAVVTGEKWVGDGLQADGLLSTRTKLVCGGGRESPRCFRTWEAPLLYTCGPSPSSSCKDQWKAMRLGGISRLTQEPCPLSLGLQEPLYLFADAMMKALRCNVGRCVSDLHFPPAAQEAGQGREES